MFFLPLEVAADTLGGMREIDELTARYMPAGEPNGREATDSWVRLALSEGYHAVEVRLILVDGPLMSGMAIAIVTVWRTEREHLGDFNLYAYATGDDWDVNTHEV